MENPHDFSEAAFITSTTTKKAARMGNWGGSSISSTSSSARRIHVDQDDGWGALQNWGSERGQPDGGKSYMTGADRVPITSRRLSDNSRESGDFDDDVRSVSSTSSDRRPKRAMDTLANRGMRSRLTANFFKDDFGETMEEMIHDFDSRFSSSFWADDDDETFFRRRRRIKNDDDFFSRPRQSPRSNFSRSKMLPSLFDSSFDDVCSGRKSNYDDDYAESGIFSDRASSRLSQQGDVLTQEDKRKKQLAADKFEVDIDVQGFKANELLVRTEGRRLAISAMKKDKEGNPLANFRELKREFVLPEGVNPYDVTSNLMPDGFLRVEAPVRGKEVENVPEETPEKCDNETSVKSENADSKVSNEATPVQ